MSVPYPLLCAGLGLVLGWLPMLFHGPIREKFDSFDIDGGVAVWCFYLARLSVGFWVGISHRPRRWWLRGPLCGCVAMVPVALFAVAVPGCGYRCLFWNTLSATVLGLLVAGLAYALTRREHA